MHEFQDSSFAKENFEAMFTEKRAPSVVTTRNDSDFSQDHSVCGPISVIESNNQEQSPKVCYRSLSTVLGQFYLVVSPIQELIVN